MGFLYSASQNGFYPEDDLKPYQDAGTLPDDLLPVSNETVTEFTPFTNGNLVRMPGSDGLPCWGERPALTPEEALIQKNALMGVASAAIAPLQDSLDLDFATDEEKTLLLAWKKYRVLLMRIDTSKAPGIEWPTPPVSRAS